MHYFTHKNLIKMLDLTFNEKSMANETTIKGPVYSIKKKKKTNTSTVKTV